jgi:hypothetical protein
MPTAPKAPESSNAAIAGWIKVMQGLTALGKGEKVTPKMGGYSFRGVDATVNAVGPLLREHGLVIVPHVRDTIYQTVTVGAQRTQMGHVRVHVAYSVYADNGDSFGGSASGEAMDAGDKATPKAMSVAFRTFLLQSLALPTGEKDPDAEVYERAPDRDWLAELEQADTRVKALSLYNQASNERAPREVLEAIKARGQQLADAEAAEKAKQATEPAATPPPESQQAEAAGKPTDKIKDAQKGAQRRRSPDAQPTA